MENVQALNHAKTEKFMVPGCAKARHPDPRSRALHFMIQKDANTAYSLTPGEHSPASG